jgi:O-antigen chain-terminating methyltransferase
MSDNFYRVFEDLHRGQRSDIMRRLQVYLPFVLPVAKANSHAPCLDLGCGRGEWLQLLKEHNLNASGVDLDLGMLVAAQAGGLQVRQADAIQALKDAADGSVAVVSAFHLIEHLPFKSLQELVTQARRVLVPGGLLIMETPNPDNLRVATNNFYLDPSHLKPIPSLLLSFATEQAGFARTKILGLQESPALRFQSELHLQDVLAGASPDYAVISQSPGPTQAHEQLNAAFERDYGINTAELAQSYSNQQMRTIKALKVRIQEIRELVHDEAHHARQLQLESAEQINEQIVLCQSRCDLLANEIDAIQGRSDLLANEIKAIQGRSDLLANEIKAIQSKSELLANEILTIQRSVIWLLVLPLQWAADQYAKLRQHGLKTRWLALLRKIGWIKAIPGATEKKHD